MNCSITEHLEIIPAGLSQYNQLSRFHYRQESIGPYAAIYAIRDGHPVRGRFGGIVGVIVYKMPSANLELRNIATDGLFNGFGDRRLQLQMVNRHIRCISRVIIEPRYRSLGLASWLVRETMAKLQTPIIEAMAVMGRVNPFFEKAGMKAYTGKMPARCVQLIEAMGMVGIDEQMLVEPQKVQQRFDSLKGLEAEFVSQQIMNFLQAYNKRRHMPPGIERTRYILSKLSARPVYYIWFNPENCKL